MGRPRAFDLIDTDTTDTKNADDRKFVGAIGRAFDVLRAFKPGQGPLGNTELSVATGLPKATVSRLTHTLTRLGYLNYLSDHGVYEPSPSILALGYCVLSNMRVRQLARDHMQQLADYGKTMCALASRDRLSMIYVSMCNGGGFRTLHMDVGSRADIATSAIGRAFLSGISEREREYFSGISAAFTVRIGQRCRRISSVVSVKWKSVDFAWSMVNGSAMCELWPRHWFRRTAKRSCL